MTRLQDLVGYLNATRLRALDAARARRFAVSLAAVTLLVVSAEVISWRAIGQGGANVIAVSGNNVYLSSDNGQSWKGGTGLPLQDFYNCIAISGATLFVGTGANGVYRSTNNGNSWVPANAGIATVSVSAIAVSGTTLFAGTGGNGFVAQPTMAKAGLLSIQAYQIHSSMSCLSAARTSLQA